MTGDHQEVRSPGADRQMEIYVGGTQGRLLPRPMAIEALEQKAKEVLRPEAYDYLVGGAGGESTMRANRDAFERLRLVPRFLRDCAKRDLQVEVAGQRLPFPLLLAPIGVQSILHQEAEAAVARAASSVGVPVILSTLSSRPLEEIAKIMGKVPHWFQLYWPKDHELAGNFCRRAEQAGYSAIVVTLDTYYLGWRERDLQRGYLPFVEGLGLANYLSDPVFRAALAKPPEEDPVSAARYFLQIVSNPSLTWKDLARLREMTQLPILLKGILDSDDGRKALDQGVDGLIVSNHGGRQLDGAIAAIDALPGVVQAVGDKISVLFDSGIRRAADVLKAAALGARAVLLGRPYCYGLAVGGEAGVRDVLQNLLADLDLSLALAGCSSLRDLSPANLFHARDDSHT